MKTQFYGNTLGSRGLQGGKNTQKLNQESKQTKGFIGTGFGMYSNHSDMGKDFRLTGHRGWTLIRAGI